MNIISSSDIFNHILILSLLYQHHARATRYASTSVAKRSSGGFFSWLTGEQSSQLPPLDFPLPGVMLPPPLPDHVEPGKTKITTLPNGVKIASETSPVCSMLSSLFISQQLSFHLIELVWVQLSEPSCLAWAIC